MISRTENGGAYGRHIDNPFMDYGESALRTDLSYTLFLSDPETYDGGELVIERAEGVRHVKPKAGTLILYPSTHLHAVRAVTGGSHLAAVGWIESRVKTVSRREILFDLENLATSLSQTYDAQSVERLTLAKVIANLKRDFS
nr:Fe2+-dependent dioxygenase [Algimonas porphyrae]